MIECNGPMPGKAWLQFPEKIAAVSERLKGVQIENQDAVKLIERYKRRRVLIYADPPYIQSTRTTTSYRHEMSLSDHERLLEALDAHPGPVILSGYDTDLYNKRLSHWRREARQAKAEGGASRVEVIWINPIAAESVAQMSIFDEVR